MSDWVSRLDFDRDLDLVPELEGRFAGAFATVPPDEGMIEVEEDVLEVMGAFRARFLMAILLCPMRYGIAVRVLRTEGPGLELLWCFG